MSEQPSQEIIDEIRGHFTYFDRDGNGLIELKEFTRLLRVIEPSATEQQAQEGFSYIDEDNNGHIDFEEFIKWWQSHWWQY